MNVTITVRKITINVELKLYAIRIFNADTLQGLLKNDAEAATEELIINIKREYQRLFNTDFKVSDASMTVEIWAHVYADKFAEVVKNHSSINLIDKIADKIIHHAEVIDIGEKGHDYNRFVWNGLAPFKGAIAAVLFAKQEK